MHNTNFEPQDICEWDKDIEVDLIMHGSPCQDFSLAGKQAGGDEGSGTRSSLMYETVRIVEKLKPKYVIWENVKNVISKKHKHNFDNYLNKMEELGYKNYWQVLNAKDYGIPQNRERVFTISILSECDYQFPNGNKNDNQIKRLFNFSARQDCRVVYDQDGLCPTLVAGMVEGGGKVPMFIENGFEFPPKQELKLKLKDMLEDNVDEKYYLSDDMIKYISVAGTTNYLSNDLPDNYDLNQVVRKYGVFDNDNKKHQAGSVYDSNGLAPTLDTMQGGYRQPCIETNNFVINKYNEFIEDNGYIPEMFNPYNKKEIKDIAPTQTTYCNSNTSSATILIKNATKQGYLEATEGDGIDISSRMKYHRGNVQKDSIQTITTSGGNDRGVVVKSKIDLSCLD